MMNQATELTYRRTAAEGATGVGLTIALYDTLAGDLRRAAAAERSDDLSRRGREINHALTVIGFLESWVDPANGKELAESLTLLYSYLRAKMMEGQLKRSAGILEELIPLVLQVRGAWQQLEMKAQSGGDDSVRMTPDVGFLVSAPAGERAGGSWSA